MTFFLHMFAFWLQSWPTKWTSRPWMGKLWQWLKALHLLALHPLPTASCVHMWTCCSAMLNHLVRNMPTFNISEDEEFCRPVSFRSNTNCSDLWHAHICLFLFDCCHMTRFSQCHILLLTLFPINSLCFLIKFPELRMTSTNKQVVLCKPVKTI